MQNASTITRAQVLAAARVGETDDWEFKAARGGLPRSLWETYSAMANSSGGRIVLGVAEKNGEPRVDGLDAKQAQAYRKQVFDILNNREKVSTNLLTSDDVETVPFGPATLLVLNVRPAERQDKPVHLGPNPIGNTFRRQHEGDYRCSDDEVRRMLADAGPIPADQRILEHFSFADIHTESLTQYRNAFSARQPDHPWLGQSLEDFFGMLGGYAVDRDSGRRGLTVAGLLMFGQERAITDAQAFPKFWLDYREYLDANERWSDRVFPDGTWEANLFQFYRRIWPKISADLPKPFKLEDGVRIDDTPAHKGLREALVNALVHTDYRAPGNIVIARHRDRFVLENPGTLLVSLDQLRRGGVSECRNPSLQKMFVMIGGGERAGSGYQTIRKGWSEAGWRPPHLETQVQPDRVLLTLPRVSLIPDDTLSELQSRCGPVIDTLSQAQLMILATALIEENVSNARLQEVLSDHPSEISRHLTDLRDKGLLVGDDRRRWTTYQLATQLPDLFTANSGSDSPNSGTDSPDYDPSSLELQKIWDDLLALAEPIRSKGRAPRDQVEATILRICEDRFLTQQQIAELLGRKAATIQEGYLAPMVRARKLRLRHPNSPNHPRQAYTRSVQREG